MNLVLQIFLFYFLIFYIYSKPFFLQFENKSNLSLRISVYLKNPIIKDLKISEFDLNGGEKSMVKFNSFEGTLYHIAVNDVFRKIIPADFLKQYDTIKALIINDKIVLNQNEVDEICNEYYYSHKKFYSRYPSGFRIYFNDTLDIFLKNILKCYDTLLSEINNFNILNSVKKHYLNEIHLQILENIYYYLKYYNIYKYDTYKEITLTNDIINTINYFETKLDTNFLLYFNSDNYLLRKFEYFEILNCNKTDTCMNAWDYYFKYQNRKNEFDLFYIAYKLKNIKNKNEFNSLIDMLKKITTFYHAHIINYLATKLLMQHNFNSFNLKNIYFYNHKGIIQSVCSNNNKEKYLLVGASWCAPCRKAFKKFLEFESKNNVKFEYIYLLIDDNKNYIKEILNELKQTKSNIQLLIDNKNFNNEILKKFNIDAIPKLFVINNNCEILYIE